LDYKKGVNTTIAEERYFVVPLMLHFKASPFGDGNGRLFDEQGQPEAV